jgi:hypothetical protein
VNFEIGQKVICMSMSECYQDKLEIGGIYTVSLVDDDWIGVMENGTVNTYEIRHFTAAPNQTRRRIMERLP